MSDVSYYLLSFLFFTFKFESKKRQNDSYLFVQGNDNLKEYEGTGQFNLATLMETDEDRDLNRDKYKNKIALIIKIQSVFRGLLARRKVSMMFNSKVSKNFRYSILFRSCCQNVAFDLNEFPNFYFLLTCSQARVTSL